MMRTWIGVALLAGSWLLGLNYYYPVSPIAWIVLVLLGTVLLGGGVGWGGSFAAAAASARASQTAGPHPNPLPEGAGTRIEKLVALLLLLPAVWWAPWPYRAAPLLLAAGLACALLPIRRDWLKWLSRGAVAAGVVMFAQALCLVAYTWQTARSHELPWPLPEALAGIARLLGADATGWAAAEGSTVAFRTIRQVHRLGATWDLLLDPATVCFFVGSLVLLAMIVWSSRPVGQRWSAWLAGLRALVLVLAVWVPIRAAVLMAVYVHRVLRTDYATPLHAMNHFFSPWVLAALALAPALLAWRFVRLPSGGQPGPSGEAAEPAAAKQPVEKGDRHYPVACGLVALAVAIFVAAVAWDPVGERKQGRVMFVDRHSTWSRTTKPYNTLWYGERSVYNYRLWYDYCAQFYQMSRLMNRNEKETDDDPEVLENLAFQEINDESLSQCDVLVIKIPTKRYSSEEVAAVQQFVERGGGLLLVGDHTNYDRSSTVMNDVTRPMGFTYRPDLVFGIESAYDESYTAPQTPHPVVQHLPPMEFAVSTSIDPGWSWGRAVVLGIGLWTMGPEYHNENYHPTPQHCAEMRYGAFIQVWATRYGKGRVLAFTDSTILSEFAFFQPGHAELALGMIEWLNHSNSGDPGPWLALLSVLPLGGGLWLARRRRGAWLMLLSAGACSWALASMGIAAVQRANMPVPTPDRPGKLVVVDRTVSDAPLAKGPYVHQDQKGFGILELCLSRLGYVTSRRSGDAAMQGDALVVLYPDRPVPAEYRQRLEKYVADGGKLLVVDSPDNAGSTANSLLWPFGLSIVHGQVWQGKLVMAKQWPYLDVSDASEVTGGQAVARLGEERAVASLVRHGKGAVMAVGFGSLWNDKSLGGSTFAEPEGDVRTRYEVLYALVRMLVEDKPIAAPTLQEVPEPKEELREE